MNYFHELYHKTYSIKEKKSSKPITHNMELQFIHNNTTNNIKLIKRISNIKKSNIKMRKRSHNRAAFITTAFSTTESFRNIS